MNLLQTNTIFYTLMSLKSNFFQRAFSSFGPAVFKYLNCVSLSRPLRIVWYGFETACETAEELENAKRYDRSP